MTEKVRSKLLSVLALKEAVDGIDGVKRVTGTASENSGPVVIELLIGAEPDHGKKGFSDNSRNVSFARFRTLSGMEVSLFPPKEREVRFVRLPTLSGMKVSSLCFIESSIRFVRFPILSGNEVSLFPFM